MVAFPKPILIAAVCAVMLSSWHVQAAPTDLALTPAMKSIELTEPAHVYTQGSANHAKSSLPTMVVPRQYTSDKVLEPANLTGGDDTSCCATDGACLAIGHIQRENDCCLGCSDWCT